MENQDRSEPASLRCIKCGEDNRLTTSMLDPPTRRIFHMFDCQCGHRTWVTERRGAMSEERTDPVRDIRSEIEALLMRYGKGRGASED
jgi:hypothetical protein